MKEQPLSSKGVEVEEEEEREDDDDVESPQERTTTDEIKDNDDENNLIANDENEVQEHAPIHEKNKNSSKRLFWTILISVVFFVVAGLAIGLGVGLSKDNDSNMATAGAVGGETEPPVIGEKSPQALLPTESGEEVNKYNCNSDAECAVKDVGNCCGYYPECVNVLFIPDPEKACPEGEGMMSICGFPTIDACVCDSQGLCKPAPN